MIRPVRGGGEREEEEKKEKKRRRGRGGEGELPASTATETATYCPAYRYSRYNLCAARGIGRAMYTR